MSTETKEKSDKSGTKEAPKKHKANSPGKGKGKAKHSRQGNKPQGKKTPAPASAKAKPAPAKPESSALKLFINADEPEECRVALVENGKLEAFHVATIVSSLLKGNIYKGRVVAVEQNLHAAFVDIGTGKNAFLPFDEIHPEYYVSEEAEDVHWKNLKPEQILEIDQELLVEVVKDPTGMKGPSVTTYLSMPGRYLVLMPGSDSHGISRKIDDEEQRKRLKEIVSTLKVPDGIGYIIRTASKDITKTALTKDFRFLLKLWREIKKRGQEAPTPSLIHEDQDIIAKYLRDHFASDIQEIHVDNEKVFRQVKRFLDLLPASQKKRCKLKLDNDPRPLFNHYNIEQQIEQIYQPSVKLPSGGSIVINPTEALVAIDVNSGGTGRDKKFEEAIYQANLEAAEEIARQIRLRDLGGLIVIDFIDMRVNAHTREVERRIRTLMKKDKAKCDFTNISKFGLMQISRQKMGRPVHAGSYQVCDHCQGKGIVKSIEAQSLVFLRQIQTAAAKKNLKAIRCRFPAMVGQYLLNQKRADISDLESRFDIDIFIEADATVSAQLATIDIERC